MGAGAVDRKLVAGKVGFWRGCWRGGGGGDNGGRSGGGATRHLAAVRGGGERPANSRDDGDGELS